MKRRPLLFVPCLSLVLMNAWVEPAKACKCAHPKPSPLQALKQADAVFIGKVTEITIQRTPEGYRQRRLKIEASKTWKGITSKNVFVTTGFGQGDCGFPFVKGKTYVVYASRFKENKQLHTNVCMRTRPLEEAREDLKLLGPAKAPR